jgi:RNA polymerase sigma-70 factor (ECF subfamily)
MVARRARQRPQAAVSFDERGDPQARFIALYEEMFAELVDFVGRHAPKAVAEDVVQATFEVVFRRREHLPADHSQCRAWVFGVAKVSLTSALRALGQRTGHEMSDENVEAVAPGGDILNWLVTDETVRWLLDSLSPAQREAITWRIIVDVPVKEVAQIMGLSVTAVTSLLSRAYDHIRQHTSTTTVQEVSQGESR